MSRPQGSPDFTGPGYNLDNEDTNGLNPAAIAAIVAAVMEIMNQKVTGGGENGGGRKKDDPSIVAGSMKALGLKMAAVLGPLAVLSQVVSSAASGFSVLMGAVRVFAASLAPVLLPVFAVLATAVSRLADTLWKKIVPALSTWYSAIVRFVDGLASVLKPVMWLARQMGIVKSGSGDAVDVATDIVHAAPGVGSGLRSSVELASDAGMYERRRAKGDSKFGAAARTAGNLFADFATFGLWRPGEKETADWRRSGGAAEYLDKTGKKRPGDALVSNEVLQELRLSMGPKAQFAGLAQVSRNAQMAALNQSPFEQKILERLQTGIVKLSELTDFMVSGGTGLGR